MERMQIEKQQNKKVQTDKMQIELQEEDLDNEISRLMDRYEGCLLYTSDAADD